MAVAIGTVASVAGIVSLTVQLFHSGKKLKEFFDDVKDAPENLRYVQERLDTLFMLLDTVKSNPNLTQLLTDSTHFKKCVGSCQTAAGHAKLFAEKLETGVARSKRWGAIKSVLKKDELKKLDDRLKEATDLLHLCCSFHSIGIFPEILQRIKNVEILVQTQQYSTMNELKVQTHAHSHSSSTMVLHESSQSSHDDSDIEEITRTFEQNDDRRPAIPRKDRKRLRLFLPFMHTIWDFEYHRSISGWDAKFRIRRVVPWDSALVKLAREADLDGVKALLSTGQASIFDEDEYGHNIIDLCLRELGFAHRQVEFCQFFLDQGINPGKIAWWLIFKSDDPRLVPLYHRITTCLREPSIMDWKNCPCQPKAIHNIATRLDPPIHSLQIEERLELALEAIMSYRYGTRLVMDAFVMRLGCELDDRRILDVIPSRSEATVRKIAYLFGLASARGDESSQTRLTNFLTATIHAGSNNVSLPGVSMLMYEYINGGLYGFSVPWRNPIGYVPKTDLQIWQDSRIPEIMFGFETHLLGAMRSWLRCLSAAGVNLVNYGREVYGETCPNSYVLEPPFLFNQSIYPFKSCRILTFHYGPNAEDWNADFSWRLSKKVQREDVARCFWEMLEYTDQPVPGAWKAEWDTRDELDHVDWYSYLPHHRHCLSVLPNRGWRKAVARYLTVEAHDAGAMQPSNRILRRHKRRLQYGAIRKAIEWKLWKGRDDLDFSHDEADETDAYYDPKGRDYR